MLLGVCGGTTDSHLTEILHSPIPLVKYNIVSLATIASKLLTPLVHYFIVGWSSLPILHDFFPYETVYLRGRFTFQ